MKHKGQLYLDGGADQICAEHLSLAGFIGYLRINIFIPHSRSLKERRQVVESVCKRIRNNFNISVAQKPTDNWKSCELFFVSAHYTKSYASDLMGRIEDFIKEEGNIHILKTEKGVV